MFSFVAVYTRCLEVGGVIGTSFTQLKSMVDMTLTELHYLTAVPASAIVALIDVLAQQVPKVWGHSGIPRETDIGEFLKLEIETGHTLPLPHRGSPLPNQGVPRLSRPILSPPGHTLTSMLFDHFKLNYIETAEFWAKVSNPYCFAR